MTDDNKAPAPRIVDLPANGIGYFSYIDGDAESERKAREGWTAATIDALWERSGHGTQREDIVAAFQAGVDSEHRDCPSFQVPPGCRSPDIEWWGKQWRCAWIRETGSIMGMVGLGDTPNDAFASWLKANTASGRDNPWSGP